MRQCLVCAPLDRMVGEAQGSICGPACPVTPSSKFQVPSSRGTFCKVDPSQSPWPAPHAHAAQPKPRKTLLPCHHSDRRETGALGLDSKPPAWRLGHPPPTAVAKTQPHSSGSESVSSITTSSQFLALPGEGPHRPHSSLYRPHRPHWPLPGLTVLTALTACSRPSPLGTWWS